MTLQISTSPVGDSNTEIRVVTLEEHLTTREYFLPQRSSLRLRPTPTLWRPDSPISMTVRCRPWTRGSRPVGRVAGRCRPGGARAGRRDSAGARCQRRGVSATQRAGTSRPRRCNALATFSASTGSSTSWTTRTAPIPLALNCFEQRRWRRPIYRTWPPGTPNASSTCPG